MVATQPRPSTGAAPARPVGPPERIVRPRRGLPGSRAVVGGLLVAVAAVGTFAAWSGADENSSRRYVVAAHTVAPGKVLGPGDLETVPMDLPASMAGRSFSDPSDLIRRVTLGPLEPGELVQAGNVLPGRDAKPQPELSFGIDAERAVAGTLRPGDRIDILVTYGTGAGSVTQLVSARARVLRIDGGASSGLSDTRRQVLTVALPSADDILELTNAARAGEITVARNSGVRHQPTGRTFQPQGPAPDAGTGAPTATAAPTTAPPTAGASTTSVPQRTGR